MCKNSKHIIKDFFTKQPVASIDHKLESCQWKYLHRLSQALFQISTKRVLAYFKFLYYHQFTLWFSDYEWMDAIAIKKCNFTRKTRVNPDLPLPQQTISRAWRYAVDIWCLAITIPLIIFPEWRRRLRSKVIIRQSAPCSNSMELLILWWLW